MIYFITGDRGFIGTNLKEAINEIVNSFSIGLDSSYTNEPYESSSHIAHDICSKLPDVKGDIFIHLAAFTRVLDSIEYPLKTFETNVLGTLNCLEMAEDEGYSRFIFISSGGAPKALSPYSASKLAGEAACLAYKNSYNLPVSVLRLSNVYGPHCLEKESVVSKFIKRILRKQMLEVYGDGKQTRDFIHVSDVVRTILSVSTEQFASVGILNVSSGQQTSLLDLIVLLTKASKYFLNYVPKVIFSHPRTGEIRSVTQVTSIKPTVQLKKGIFDTFEWLKDNYDY